MLALTLLQSLEYIYMEFHCVKFWSLTIYLLFNYSNYSK